MLLILKKIKFQRFLKNYNPAKMSLNCRISQYKIVTLSHLFCDNDAERKKERNFITEEKMQHYFCCAITVISLTHNYKKHK